MNIVCLDLEGVLVPEIWIEFAEATDIPELKRTTPRARLQQAHGVPARRSSSTQPWTCGNPANHCGYGATLSQGEGISYDLRENAQVIIVSDTFEQFAQPLMKKLDWPTIFCNTLEVAADGTITGFRMRCEETKLTTVRALQSCGFETIASGDSHNDIGMIKASKAGFLFRSPDFIKNANPDILAFEEYADLANAIKAAL